MVYDPFQAIDDYGAKVAKAIGIASLPLLAIPFFAAGVTLGAGALGAWGAYRAAGGARGIATNVGRGVVDLTKLPGKAVGMGTGLYRAMAWQPGGAKALIQPGGNFGRQINPVLIRRLAVGGLALGIAKGYMDFNRSGMGAKVAMGADGSPEVRRPGDLSATGSLGLALYSNAGRINRARF